MARFTRRGKMKLRWLPAVAAATGAPTAAEVTAGTDLTPRVADLAGWTVSASSIATPDLVSRFTPSIPGEITVADSSITYYADDANADPLKTLMPMDQAGWVYIQKQGAGTGLPADLFPVRVMSVGDEYSVGNDPARMVIPYAVTAQPRTDVAQA